ncbi:unnamed protein product, partial [Ixodes persulcatus]
NLDLRECAASLWKKRIGAQGAKLFPWKSRHISFFTRSYLCNAISYPAILYSAQVMPFSTTTADKVQSSWAVFIWKSSMERMRRQNLFLSLAKGGLGLINIGLKLVIHRFLFFRDQQDPFILSAFHHLGASQLLAWQVTTATPTPFSRVLFFYKEIAQSIRLLQNTFSWDFLLKTNRKQLYWATVSALIPPPLYRPLTNLPTDNDVFHRLKCLPVATSSKDFFFKFHTEVLPVKVWQQAKGFFVPWSHNCDLCGKEETLEHVFIFCSNAEIFWAELQSFFGLDLQISWCTLKFLRRHDQRTLTDLTEIIMVLGLHALWRSRIDMTECTLHPKPAWQHFASKLNWTIRTLEPVEIEKDLRDALVKGQKVALNFH